MINSNFSTMSEQQLEVAGAHSTAREIAQQPEIWRRMAAAGSQAAHQFLAPLLTRPDLQIVLTGAGTSAHIGECLVPSLMRRFGARVRAVPTTDLVADPDGSLGRGPLLLVSFARSGNSPESLAAVTLAGQISSACSHLIITCNSKGALCRVGESLENAHVVRLPEETNDQAFAMTSSFSCMLLAAALAFEVLEPQGVTNVAGWGAAVLAGSRTPRELADKGYDRVVYLGDRELRGLAREAALKLLELTDGRVVALSETPLAFRHGPKAVVNANTLVIVLLSNHAYTRAYQRDLVKELRNDGVAARVVAICADASADDSLPISGAESASDLELCFPYAVFAQSLALQTSLALGLRPDSPNRGGTVNRVVQGVVVYPWIRAT